MELGDGIRREKELKHISKHLPKLSVNRSLGLELFDLREEFLTFRNGDNSSFEAQRAMKFKA